MSNLKIGHLEEAKKSLINDIPVQEGTIVYTDKSGMQFVDFAGDRHTYGSILSGIYSNKYGFLDFANANLKDVIDAIKDNGFVVDGQIIRAGNTVYQYRKVREKHYIIKLNQTGIVMDEFKIRYAVYLPEFVQGDKVAIDLLIANDNNVYDNKVYYVKIEDNDLDVSQCDDMNDIFNPDEFDISVIHDGNGLFTLSTTITSTMNIISCTVNSTGSSIHEEFYIMESDLEIVYDWVKKSSAPYAICESSAVVLNNELHILGGTNGPLNHYKWNGTQWASESALPFSFIKGSAIMHRGELHILTSTNHYKWDGTQWINVSTLPYELTNGCAISYLNDIHIFGGTGNLRTHYLWDGESWVKSTDIPFDFINGSVVLYNKEVHILGSNSHYKWDAAVWTKVSDIPFNYSNGDAVVYDGIINLICGTDYYKWDGNEWLKISIEVPYSFINGSAVVFDNDVNILGGNTTGTTNHYEFYKGIE